MMQPPRQILAMSPLTMSQPYSAAPACDRVEALRVRDDLRGVEREPNALDEGLGVGGSQRLAIRAGQRRRGSTLRRPRTERPREDRLRDPRHRHAEVERGLHRPHAGALRTRLVFDHVHERPARLRVDVPQHLGGDLDEVALELALVPRGEDVGDLGGGLAGAAADEVVGLRDELHVGVFDAVVDHLDEVPGAVVSDVGDTGLALGDGGDGPQDRSERDPRLIRPARHDRRTVERTLLAAGDAGADEVDPPAAHGSLAADGVGEDARCRRRR